ncbi:hypothetical protein AAAX56_04425 [Hominicoprocola fusiformis]
MLTFEKILQFFDDILKQGPLNEVAQTSHGYTLLNAYSGYLEDKITRGERDNLTPQEQKKVEVQCRQLRKKCLAD